MIYDTVGNIIFERDPLYCLKCFLDEYGCGRKVLVEECTYEHYDNN